MNLAAAHSRELSRFLSHRTADAMEVQDLLQEVYLRILRIERPEAIQYPKAYFFKIAASVAYEHRRRRSSRPTYTSFEEIGVDVVTAERDTDDLSEPHLHAELAERLHQVVQHLNELPPHVRAAVVWHHRDGYTCKEIGRKLSVVPHRVKKYLVRGLAHCRRGYADSLRDRRLA